MDRLCIARLKWQKISENKEELDWYENEWAIYSDNKQLKMLCEELLEVHSKIWDLEADIRNSVDNKMPLEEIGRRAIQIRDWNNKRIAIKNKASETVGSTIREIKRNHLSE